MILGEHHPNLGSVDRILPILVLYNCALQESSTYRTFIASSRRCSTDAKRIAIYDNSPERQVGEQEKGQLLAYRHNPGNGGLTAAYNWGLELAVQDGSSWLALLDQDSELPLDFMADAAANASAYAYREEVAAVVPHVTSREVQISPSRVKFGRLTLVPATFTGIVPYESTAINSGVLIKTSFVSAQGGFSPFYWLDGLDHWLFHRIHAAGKTVAVSASVVEHDLSVRDYRRKVDAERYRNIMNAEAAFVTTNRPHEIPVYLLRLFFRTWKQLLFYRKAGIATITAEMALNIATRPWISREVLSDSRFFEGKGFS